MKKLILLLITVLSLSVLSGCKAYDSQQNLNNEEYDDYFVLLQEWSSFENQWKIVYAKDTKVKYVILNRKGISPLYNADGTLQIYKGENQAINILPIE
jgi:hypothetical protein